MKNSQHTPSALPLNGKSRWSQAKKYIPFSRETFRKLSKAGLAPKIERLGVRCSFLDNAELHRFLKDPAAYRVDSKK